MEGGGVKVIWAIVCLSLAVIPLLNKKYVYKQKFQNTMYLQQ